MNPATFHNRIGEEMHRLIAALYPICRSITGDGVRETLAILQRTIPLEIHEVPSGTPVYDWVVPEEWNITDASVKNSRGEKVIDFQKSNLHLVSYSTPVHETLSLARLKEHLYSLPDHPDWIPYRTAYYRKEWGFCLSHRDLLGLEEGDYEVSIESTLQPGHLVYGEYSLPGSSPDEVLISCHCCHPSLCNDNLSGVALVTHLAKNLAALPLRYSYRFLFIPATIGAITWLCLNEANRSNIKHGLVVANVGDPGRLTYKKSRRGDAEIDQIVSYVLNHSGSEYQIVDFSPYGYDERQFCSPGINLPVGSLTRTPYGQYAEYHTSADNLEFVRPQYLEDSFSAYWEIIQTLEGNRRYLNTNPNCEPQLGKRGLYEKAGGKSNPEQLSMAMLWVLNYSDGQHTLLEIAEKSGIDFDTISTAAHLLKQHQLLIDHP